jgi:predicted HTH transcriptional regulator
MRWNWKENKLDKKMEEIILKTISAFSNAEGGKLLIGVTDEGEILGLESDYNTFKEANKDHFELHLRNIVNNAFGKEYTATNLNVRFPIVNDAEICEIDIKASNKPLYLEVADKNGAVQKKFYIRSGNTSQELDIQETASFIIKRF